ncbi:hypothetical protein HPB47_016422 [Ixodes persulcatus]|uniref:Uncharacterized protein n=1 Tax=Ixodes persulcatus TaxID=34615 RepID=A0AC60QQY7_IXOPE|nr:hypothetical protein HPB47_016422 [Ixodes persulcatus]
MALPWVDHMKLWPKIQRSSFDVIYGLKSAKAEFPQFDSDRALQEHFKCSGIKNIEGTILASVMDARLKSPPRQVETNGSRSEPLVSNPVCTLNQFTLVHELWAGQGHLPGGWGRNGGDAPARRAFPRRCGWSSEVPVIASPPKKPPTIASTPPSSGSAHKDALPRRRLSLPGSSCDTVRSHGAPNSTTGGRVFDLDCNDFPALADSTTPRADVPTPQGS